MEYMIIPIITILLLIFNDIFPTLLLLIIDFKANISKLKMCYFPIGCLKGVVTIGAFCSILISLGLLAGINKI
jgi:phage-related minor tail protein